MTFVEYHKIKFFHSFNVAQALQFLTIIFTVTLSGALDMYNLPTWYTAMPFVFCAVTYTGVMAANMIFKDYIQHVEYISIKYKLTRESQFGNHAAGINRMCTWLRRWMVYGLTGSFAINANIMIVLLIAYHEFQFTYVPEHWLDFLYNFGVGYCVFVVIVTAIFGVIKEIAVKRMRKMLDRRH